MLITEALNEVKLLEKRIEKTIEQGEFAKVGLVCSDFVKSTKKSKKTFVKDAESTIQSVKDMVARMEHIKYLINDSNAKTDVVIGDEKMKVSEAIIRKNTIVHEKMLLEYVAGAYASAKNLVDKDNESTERFIDKLLETTYGKDSKNKITTEEQESISVPYRRSHEEEVVSIPNVEEWIKKQQERIDSFESKVDSALQISNCTTWIELE